MLGPWKHPNGVFYFRRGVPERLRKIVGKREERISLNTRDPAAAKLQFLDVAKAVQDRWHALEAQSIAPSPEPLRLTTIQVHGLAGEMYREIVAEHRAEPGSPERWTEALGKIQWTLPPDKREPGAKGPPRMFGFGPDAMAIRLLGPEMDAFLKRRGIAIDQDSRHRLASAAATAIAQARQQLRRNAEGNFMPDPLAERFPPAPELAPPPREKLTVETLFAKWSAEARPAAKTAKRYLGALNALLVFLKTDDVLTITEDDMYRWKQHRMDLGMSPKTIRAIDLAVPKSIFAWAVGERKLMPVNPAANVTIKVPKKSTKVVRDKGYTYEEAVAVLRGTLVPASKRMSPERAAARRWVPWLCAYGGARVNEVTQMDAEHIVLKTFKGKPDVWVMHITPEAGTVKDGEYRDVPLHPHVIEQGFLDYVKSRKGKKLFYDPDRARGATAAHLQSEKTGESLAAWVRKEVGIKDPRLQPNHAWRHRFRSIGRSLKVPTDVLNQIDGHAAQTVADAYGDFWPWVLHEAICEFPRYEV